MARRATRSGPLRGQPLSALDGRMRQIASAISEAAEQTHRRIVVELATDLSRDTPADTTQARSNWAARSGAPSAVIRRPFSPVPSRWRAPYGPGATKAEAASPAGVQAQAQAAMSRHRAEEDVHVTNNLPYIQRLDEGYSPQSSAGFVHRRVLLTASNVGQIFTFFLRRLL